MGDDDDDDGYILMAWIFLADDHVRLGRQISAKFKGRLQCVLTLGNHKTPPRYNLS